MRVPVRTQVGRWVLPAMGPTRTHPEASCGKASLRHTSKETSTKTTEATSQVPPPKEIIVLGPGCYDGCRAKPGPSSRLHEAPAFGSPKTSTWRPAEAHPPAM